MVAYLYPTSEPVVSGMFDDIEDTRTHGRNERTRISNYFEAQWQSSYWGSNYAKLAAAKRAYDPEGLFWVHHGVGSEAWSDDGFTPRTA